MDKLIPIIILIIAAILAVRYFSRIAKGQNKSCCSSGNYKPKKKKLSNVHYQKIFQVEGMTCEHCKARVEEVVNDMKNLSGIVDLKKGELTVSYAEEADDETIKARIERAGYTVTGIK